MLQSIVKRYRGDDRSGTSGPMPYESAMILLDTLEVKYRDAGYEVIRMSTNELSAVLNEHKFKFVIADEPVIQEQRIDSRTAKQLLRERYRVVRYDDEILAYQTPRYQKNTAEKQLAEITKALARASAKLVKRRAGARVYSRMFNVTLTEKFTHEYEEGKQLKVSFVSGKTVTFKVVYDPY